MRPSHNYPTRLPFPVAAALVGIAALLVGGCGSAGEDLAGRASTAIEEAAGDQGSSPQSGDSPTATVTQVTDGDTVSISPAIMGRSEVRLVGVDAPEDTSETDPLGPQATAFAERRLEGE